MILTFRELKDKVAVPWQGQKAPTARNLCESGTVAACRQIKGGAGIAAYQNGFVLYHVQGCATVFPVHICGDYQYESGGASVRIREDFFEEKPWYVRLVLEGEDRLIHNQEKKEQRKRISYSAISEEWAAMDGKGISALEQLEKRETGEEMLKILTKQQRRAAWMYFVQQKTQKQIAGELGISAAAVSLLLSHAVCRLRKAYWTD